MEILFCRVTFQYPSGKNPLSWKMGECKKVIQNHLMQREEQWIKHPLKKQIIGKTSKKTKLA